MASDSKPDSSDNKPVSAEPGKADRKKEGEPPPAKAEASRAGQEAPGAEVKPVRAKVLRTVSVGIAHVNATFNNTQISITDPKGQVLAWSSSGRMGFKGTRKSTAYAATIVAQEVARMVSPYRMQEIEVRVQGPGSGRESAVRALQSAGLTITAIRDVTPMPHNGCRPRKRRRV